MTVFDGKSGKIGEIKQIHMLTLSKMSDIVIPYKGLVSIWMYYAHFLNCFEAETPCEIKDPRRGFYEE